MQIRTRAAAVIALVLVVSLVALPVGAATAQLGAVTVDGDAVVQTEANETYLWQSEPLTVNTSFATDTGGVYQFCLEANVTGNQSHRLACQSKTIENDTTTPVSFAVKNLSKFGGETRVTVLATQSFNSSASTANRSTTVYVIQKTGDFDNDGLKNRGEVRVGTNINGTDTDGDGLPDGPEVQEYDTSPTKADTDGDGLQDGDEIQAGTNATNPDTDGDGLTDGEEDELGTNATNPDTDGDGLTDAEEVRKYDTDPTNADSNNNGISDSEELANGTNPIDDDADTDGDGLSDKEELEAGTNATKADSDGDLLSDQTELNLGTDPNDSTTPLILMAGLGFLTLGLIGCIRVFGPDDLSDLLPSGDFGGGSPSTTSGVATNATNGSTPHGGSDDPIPSGGSSATTAAGNEAADDDGLPFDLSDPLTDEDEVLKLLYEADGRLRQSEINNSTDWSKSKVSRLLSSMEDDGKIRKITIGRENLVTLADRVPESAESPFEDEAN